MDRTPDQKITNDPFVVTLGETDFKLKRLPIGASKEWRTKVIDHDTGIAQRFNQEDATEKIRQVSTLGVDMIVQLILDFTEKQKGDKVTLENLLESTDEQLFFLYGKLIEVTFPNGVLDAGRGILVKHLTTG